MNKRRAKSVFDCQNTEKLQAIIDLMDEVRDRAAYELMRENARVRLLRNTREGLERLKTIPDRVAVRISDGETADAAIDAVAADLGCPRATVVAYWRRATQAEATAARELRNGRIWQLATAGCSNSEIGSAMNLHPSTVSKIISAMKKRRAREGMHRP